MGRSVRGPSPEGACAHCHRCMPGGRSPSRACNRWLVTNSAPNRERLPPVDRAEGGDRDRRKMLHQRISGCPDMGENDLSGDARGDGRPALPPRKKAAHGIITLITQLYDVYLMSTCLAHTLKATVCGLLIFEVQPTQSLLRLDSPGKTCRRGQL